MTTWNPEAYAKSSAAQLNWAQELRARLALGGDENLLDVGCGDGKITAGFAVDIPRGRLVGVDSSVKMVAFAARSYPQASYPNLSFANADARALPFQDAFDLVFSNATLHWMGDHPAFLSGAQRALRGRGRLVISCGGQGNAADVLAVFAGLAERLPWRDYYTPFYNPYFFYSPDEYRPWLEGAGFSIQRLELVPKDMVHPGPEGLEAWIRTTWMPLTGRVPERLRDRLVADFLEAYLARYPLDSEGRVHVRMVRLEVQAQREET